MVFISFPSSVFGSPLSHPEATVTWHGVCVPGTGVTPGSIIQTSHLSVPVLSPPSGLSLASSLWLLLVTVVVSQGLPPPRFFSDPYLSYCSSVPWPPVLPDKDSHNLKTSRVKTTQYCVRFGSGVMWTAFIMVPGLQAYHLYGILASLVTNDWQRFVGLWGGLWSICAHCSSNAVIGLLRVYTSIRTNQHPTDV